MAPLAQPDAQYICETVVLDLTCPDVPPVSVTVDLVYDTTDPLAVHALFRTGPKSEICWTFARDLLRDGLHEPAGVGDLRIRPFPQDPAKVQLELASPSGHALFTTCADAIKDFLQLTDAAVPPGHEHDGVDVELELAELLLDH